MFKDISNFLCFERLQRPIGRYLIGYTGSARSSERRFDAVPACDEPTDEQTHDDSIYRAGIASRSN